MTKVNHIGIIVDGNGRWAKEKGKSRSEGHKAGAETLEKIILYISKENIANYLSLYVFSTENFSRSPEEVNYLMELFMKWFKKCKEKYKDANIKVLFSSQKEFLKPEIVKAIDELEEATKDNTGLVVNFCLSYGGRQEIVDATKKIATAVLENKLNINDINEELFKKYLYNDLPDVDFLIRTSGENRVSNFMLWQISYAEMYFPKVYFPDFTPKCLEEAIEEYEKRDRRFGNVK
ncbi:di-trans,poly-cis-decaprenylcistransferase [bacterium]|jgi:di-trans,poly-cis-decaprenylcistransferase|nr:di-trans,poly-cis-decaprenylcistransferase [bacterium]